MLYADVLIPLALPAPYTYTVPLELQEYIKERSRVIVQFGPRRFYTGIVVRLHEVPPRYDKIKAIHDLLDIDPLFTEMQFKLLKWMARYYPPVLKSRANLM